LAVERDGRVHATAKAPQTLRDRPTAAVASLAEVGTGPKLSVAQEDLLATLCRRPGPHWLEELDGRPAKALVARGFAQYVGSDHVEATELGYTAHQQTVEPRNDEPRRRGRPRREHPRAASILRAVKLLEKVVPRDSELVVGTMFCHIDDLLHGFRHYARRLNQGAGKPKLE
jgi:hypothetical protein